jgi:Carboxypeptidase regulatory-like domain
MKRMVSAFGVALLISMMSTVGWAQATAQINGAVKDQTGAVLPGVDITATQTETGISRTAVSDETGSYILPNLAVGPYRLEASLPGFRTYVQTGIVLQVNASPVINPVLEVGQVSEQVEVQANATLVETRTVGVGQVIENERILELPLNGRQVTDLITLSGAAVQTATNVPDRNMPQVTAMSVAGGLSTGTVYILDGAMHNDIYSNYNLPLPFPDALQEFKVETSALSAQYGMYSGASVNSVTKSGTNQFHGDLFEFVRNDLFNARNYFATKNSTLKRNQFGGTIGGPIKQNKLFFFGGYQGTTVRQDPADSKSFIPTAAMLDGDFTAITSPACNSGRTITLRAPFVNNRIDPARFSPAAVNLAKRLPTTNDPCGLVTYGIRKPTNERQIVGKVDYQLSDKQSLFGRSVVTLYKQDIPYELDANLLNTTVLGFDDRAQSYAFGDTYLISPNTINSFRLAVNRTTIMRAPAKFVGPTELGVKNWFDYDPKHITLSVTGGFSVGVPYGPIRNTSYQISDDFSLIRGTHQIAIGGSLAHWRSNLNALTSPSLGGFSFTGAGTGMGLADFLTGNLTTFTQKSPSETYMSEWYTGLFAADSWKATRRLTFNYGVRWEPYIPQVIRNGKMANFSEDRYKANMKSSIFNNAPIGFYFPGDPGFPGANCRPNGGLCNATGVYHKLWQFTPRVGFAWDVRGDGRMSVRSSYSMAHDMLSGGFYNNFISSPWAASVTVASPPGGFDNPWQGYPGGNPFPPKPVNANSEFPPFSNYFVVPYDSPQTTRHSWNLSLQRQIATDWLVSASYMGSHSDHLWGAQELNPAIYIPGTCQAGQYGLTAAGPCSTTGNANARRRLTQQYPNIGGTTLSFLSQYQPGGTQTYNGLLLSVQRRAARGVTLGGNYTWSHCYGDDAKASQGGGPGATYVDPNNRDFDRGNCEGDRRQIFNMTAVAQTPGFTNTTLRTIVTGWRLSGIYRYSTGSWLTIASGQDRSLSGVSSQRAQQILGNPYGAKTLTNYLNPAAFALPALGSFGNISPNSIQGPGTWAFDLALSRVFQIRENQKLEARAEAYNVTNSLRRGNPVTNFSNGIFGQINSSLDPRILQFALKYVF